MTLLWLLCAVFPSFLHATSNLVDQYIIRVHTAASPFSFIALSGAGSLPVVLLLLPYMVGQPHIDWVQGLLVMITGSLFSACVIPYFYALEEEDGHMVIPVFQTSPVFVAILGWVFLGEHLNSVQILGGAVVIVAAAASLIDLHHFVFKRRPFFLILLSSIIYSLFFVALRAVALDTHWLVVTFWLCVGWLIESVVIFVVAPALRTRLFQKIYETRGRLYILGTAQQVLDIGANASLAAALSFAAFPAAVTDLAMGVQPFISALWGFIAALLVPQIFSFQTTARAIWQKIICFLTILFGLYLVIGVG